MSVTTEVQQAEQHFSSSNNMAEASQNLITDVQNIQKLGAATAKVDIAQLNNDLHLKDKGFPVDFTIVSATGNDLLLQDPQNANRQLVFDTTGTLKFDGTPARALEFACGTTDGGATDKKSGDGTPNKAATGADNDGSPRDYQVQKGDSLWKIAKRDLPDGATPKQILEHVHKIEELNSGLSEHPDLIKTDETLKLPPKAKDDTAADKTDAGKDQGKTTVDKDGNKITTWNDGTERHENQDGTVGYVKHPDKSEDHWGPKAEDNYKIDKAGTKIAVTYGQDGEKIETSPDGSKVTTWKDGTERHESADGKTGYVKQADGYEHHWGPKPEDNYEVSDGIKVSGAGASASKTYDDGTVKTINGDGSGSVKSPDGSEHHWGPNLPDNYDVSADGTKTCKTADGGVLVETKDGAKTTTWPDGTVKSENKDGTVGFVKNPDKSEHHWGPNDDQNYDVTAAGVKQPIVNSDQGSESSD